MSHSVVLALVNKVAPFRLDWRGPTPASEDALNSYCPLASSVIFRTMWFTRMVRGVGLVINLYVVTLQLKFVTGFTLGSTTGVERLVPIV